MEATNINEQGYCTLYFARLMVIQRSSKGWRGVAENSDWKTLLSLSGDVVVCFILGGLALAAVLTPITYFTVRTLVRKYRSGRSGNGNRLP